jgi:hypothetical protein
MTADPRVARLRTLDTAAAPAPWWVDADGELCNGRDPHVCMYPSAADAALIAAMRNAWPAVVTLLEGVLERHRDTAGCADVRAALVVLDTLDPP